MRPTYTKQGDYYMPVIVHDDGRREMIPGPPLSNRKTATKYAALELQDRQVKYATLLRQPC
jgi:hypothetical protein